MGVDLHLAQQEVILLFALNALATHQLTDQLVFKGCCAGKTGSEDTKLGERAPSAPRNSCRSGPPARRQAEVLHFSFPFAPWACKEGGNPEGPAEHVWRIFSPQAPTFDIVQV